MDFAQTLLLILTGAFVGAFAAHKLHIPTIVGYLVSGIVISLVFSRYLTNTQIVESIASTGVAFLMFTLGMEFTGRKLRHVGEVVILGSLIQVLVTIFLGILLFPRLGFNFYNSLFMGAAFSLSSTALVVKIISDRGELDTLPGEISSGWLLLQDLLTVPMIILLPTIGRINTTLLNPAGVLFDLGKSILLLLVLTLFILSIGRQVVPFILGKIADLRSRELLLLAVVSLCLLFAFGGVYIGLSFAIGAFLAGILITSSASQHAIFAEIRPLRDIFSVVFFVSLGFLLHPEFIIQNIGKIILITFLIMLMKFVISSLLVLYFRHHSRTAIFVGLSLTSVGEFAFVLALLGLNQKLINLDTYYIILSVALLSLLVSPPFLTNAYQIYYLGKKAVLKIPFLQKLVDRLDGRQENNTLPNYENHVLILGHGRVGKYIGRALDMTQIPYVVVDYNHHLVKKLRSRGTNVIYGDPSEFDVLNFAGADKAKVIVIAIPDRLSQEMIIANILTLAPQAKIVCRIHHEEDQKRLKSLGVELIVQPEFEAAISISSKLLSFFGRDKEEIDGKILRLKIEHGLN